MDMRKIKMNTDYRLGDYNGQPILIKGECEQVVLLNQSSRELINLLIEKRNIRDARNEWIGKMQGLVTEQRLEDDFDEGVKKLTENNIFIEILCEKEEIHF